MNYKYLLRFVALVSTLLGATACTVGKRPFMLVQLCLYNEQGLSKFTEIMRSVASSEGMEFIDGSEETRQQLDMITKVHPERIFEDPVIHMGMHGGNGGGLTAANLGLRRFQVAVGFSEGRDPPRAHRFAEAVVKKLEQHWQVETVPAGQGARPMAACENSSDVQAPVAKNLE